MDFLERCMTAGLGTLVDRISYHGYRAQPEKHYIADVRAFRALVKNYDPKLDIWNGENGTPSLNNDVGGLSNFEWSEATQARWLLRRSLIDFNLGLELTSYFHASDKPDYGRITYGGPESRGDTTNSKGLIRAKDYSAKPSYYAYRNLCTLFDSETRNADYFLRFDEGKPEFEDLAIWGSTFARKGRPMYAFWYPSNLQQPYTERTARVWVYSGKQVRLERPVVVDLLTGEIRKPAKMRQAEGYWVFDEMPVQDYPRIVTDQALVR